MLPEIRPEINRIQPYVPGKPIEEVKRELGLRDVIKLASNENPLGPSKKAIEAVRLLAENLHLYPDGNCFALKEALASHLSVPLDWLFVGNGSDEIIKLLAEAFVNKGDEVVFGDPSFSEYAYACRLMGGVEVPVGLREERYDLEKMAEALTDRTKIVFVCNPNNPTGAIVTKAEVDEFLTRVPENVLVVFDEAYYEYVDSADYPNTVEYVGQNRNVVILRTFSKIYGLAGLRIGYSIAPPLLTATIARVKEPFNVNSAAQAAAIASLGDREHVLESRRVNREGLEYLYKEFERLNLPCVPSQTNFVFVDCKVDSRRLFQALLRKGVIVRTGDIFGRPTFIRVTVGTAEENTRFVEALEETLEEIRASQKE